MRLRIFDLNTPWFWLTMFFNRSAYGKPKFELSVWEPNRWQRWWVHFWLWEKLPDERGGYAPMDVKPDVPSPESVEPKPASSE